MLSKCYLGSDKNFADSTFSSLCQSRQDKELVIKIKMYSELLSLNVQFCFIEVTNYFIEVALVNNIL